MQDHTSVSEFHLSPIKISAVSHLFDYTSFSMHQTWQKQSATKEWPKAFWKTAK